MKETERVPKKQRDKNINLVIRSGLKIHLIGIIHSLQKKKRSFTKVCAIMPNGLKGNTNKHMLLFLQANQACLWQYTEVLLESMTTCET